jgi:arsenite transporter
VTSLILERHQVWLYLIAIAIGLLTGSILPVIVQPLEMAIWPVLCLLLYVIFTQIRLAELPHAFRETRFLGAAVIGNFLFVPLLAWGLVQWLPEEPVLRVGVLLVLLVPCTDWFIAFSQLGRSDVRRAIAITPLNLLLQILLLPFYL